jgi:uncharacterized membrane protein
MTATTDRDEGSTTPLILGFFLIALLFTAGSISVSDAFTKQRDLQSVCDGAAIVAANAVGPRAMHANGTHGAALPLSDADTAIAAYLADDVTRSGIRAAGRLSADGGTVELTCGQHTHIAFGRLIGKGAGIDQQASASARSPVIP